MSTYRMEEQKISRILQDLEKLIYVYPETITDVAIADAECPTVDSAAELGVGSKEYELVEI